MAQILKPSNLSLTWASSGDILDPGDTKYATGWQVEIPPRQWFNFLDNRQDEAIAHINQLGIAQWDAATEYQYGASTQKSLVMGSDGTIYRTLQTSINQNPTTTVGTYWEIAFANAGDFYTKTQSDARYLQIANNLSDLTNTATARTNLSVYSQAQTYTKTEVDAVTTVASVAQAQAQTSDVVLLTPSKLSSALKGANQSLTANGFQSFPGGLLVQWGTTTTSASADVSVTFSAAFPNGVLAVLVTASEGGSGAFCNYNTPTLTAVNIAGWSAATTRKMVGCSWVAIGF